MAANARDYLFDRFGQTEWWTREAVIAAIKTWAKRTGSPPTSNEWAKSQGVGGLLIEGRIGSRPCAMTVHRIFGSWNAAIQAAGFEARPQRYQVGHPGYTPTRWTREKVIAAIKTWAKRHGAPPKLSDWQGIGRDAPHPSAPTVLRVFGSWNAGIEAAGFEPRMRRSAHVRWHVNRDIVNPECEFCE